MGQTDLDGSLLWNLAGIVITAGEFETRVVRSGRFGEIRSRFVTTGGTFRLDFRWLESEADVTNYLAEDTGITDGSDTPVDGPYLEIRLGATVSDVTITRGSIYGARSPSA